MSDVTPDWLRRLPRAALSFARYGWTTTTGPDFREPVGAATHADAVARLVSAAGLSQGAWVDQVHGGQVIRAQQPGCLGQADAMWTTEPGLGVVGRSADCPVILVGGPGRDGRVICGFAHASWRSTVAGITGNLLGEMLAFGLQPNRAQAIVCPSAGPCCYEVGPELREAAVAAFGPTARAWFPRLGTGMAFDLWQANCAQLAGAGLAAANIFRSDICTICGGDTYHSYRRSGVAAGRFACVIGTPAVNV